VAVGADDVEPAEFDHPVAVGLVATPETDVGAASGHVGGDGHCAQPARLGDDLCFALVVGGVEHLAVDAASLQALGQVL